MSHMWAQNIEVTARSLDFTTKNASSFEIEAPSCSPTSLNIYFTYMTTASSFIKTVVLSFKHTVMNTPFVDEIHQEWWVLARWATWYSLFIGMRTFPIHFSHVKYKSGTLFCWNLVEYNDEPLIVTHFNFDH